MGFYNYGGCCSRYENNAKRLKGDKMPMKDITQHKKKLKHPQLRAWVHNSRGDDYYYSEKGTKKNLMKAMKDRHKIVGKRDGLHGRVQGFFVAHKGGVSK